MDQQIKQDYDSPCCKVVVWNLERIIAMSPQDPFTENTEEEW